MVCTESFDKMITL